MGRGAKALIAAVLCAVPCVYRVPVIDSALDGVRFEAGYWCSRPWTWIAEATTSHDDGDALPLTEPLPASPRDSCIPVLWTASKRFAVVGLGTVDGVRVGQAVSSEGVFVGTVDRCSPRLARVRLLWQPSARLGGEVLGPARDGEREVLARILLCGRADGIAEPLDHGLLVASHVGAEVFTVPDTSCPEPLLIGQVTGRPGHRPEGVRLAMDAESLQWVRIHGSSKSAAAPIFGRREVKVNNTRDRSTGTRSWLLDVGRRDGVTEGTWLLADGVLVGRVHRASWHRSRVRPIAAARDVKTTKRYDGTEIAWGAPDVLPAGLPVSRAAATGAHFEVLWLLPRDELGLLTRGLRR